MTRNERIRGKCREIMNVLWNSRRWVEVHIAPGHTCKAPFTTLDPEQHAKAMDAVGEILRELEGKR